MTPAQTDSPTLTDTNIPDEIEITQLSTYTNEVYSYRVEYPVGWTIYDSDPQSVRIRSPRGFGQLLPSVLKPNRQYTLEEIVNVAIRNSRQNIATFTVLDQQDVTLDSGQPAHVIDWRYGDSNDQDELFRAKYLVTVAGSLIYQVEFGVLQANYTAAIDQVAAQIIGSFTLL